MTAGTVDLVDIHLEFAEQFNVVNAEGLVIDKEIVQLLCVQVVKNLATNQKIVDRKLDTKEILVDLIEILQDFQDLIEILQDLIKILQDHLDDLDTNKD